MVRVEVSKVFRAPRETVYGKLFDYENLPKVSTIVQKTKVLSREGNTTVVEQEGKMLGRSFKTQVRARYEPPGKLTEELIAGDATGTQLWTLTEVPDGTKVSIVSDITPKGFLGRFFSGLAASSVQRVIEEEFEALRKHIETPT
jgi:carbon monoxide dehydrogenase subunit G